MFEGLFGIYSHTLSRLHTLERLRDIAIDYQKRGKEATIYNRKIKKEYMDAFLNKKKILEEKKILQKEILDVLKMGISMVRFPSEVPFKPDQFAEKAEDIIKKITNYGDKNVCI